MFDIEALPDETGRVYGVLAIGHVALDIFRHVVGFCHYDRRPFEVRDIYHTYMRRENRRWIACPKTHIAAIPVTIALNSRSR